MKWEYEGNYYNSLEKWQKIVSSLEKVANNPTNENRDEIVIPLGYCGFCFETLGERFLPDRTISKPPKCIKCELHKSKLCNDAYEEKKASAKTAFWQIMIQLQKNDYAKSLELAKVMLSKIQELKPDGQDKSTSVSAAYSEPLEVRSTSSMQNM